MRKLLLLFAFIALSISSFGQIPDTLYHESFMDPSGAYQVVNGSDSLSGAVSSTTVWWNDTDQVYTNPNYSYHVYGDQVLNDVWFETTPFSTVGFPYVFFSFNHICKLWLANEGRVQISIDGGNNWTILPASSYKGSDVGVSGLYTSNQYFNGGSYTNVPTAGSSLWGGAVKSPPDNTMWAREQFDLRGLAYDTIGDSGHVDVRLRFNASFINKFPVPPPGIFYDGWYVDSLMVLGSTCELEPPVINFNVPASVCLEKPTGGVVEDPSNNYHVKLLATDVGAGMDKVDLTWTNRTTNVTTTVTMTPSIGTGEYDTDITNVLVGDTVDWFVVATDLSCPNTTRNPVQGFHTFWVNQGLPAKCGSPYCGNLPSTISAPWPWVETFEGGEWVAGNNGATAGTDNAHRGTFPTFPDGYWVVGPSPAASNSNLYAWSIANTGTSTNFTGPNSNHTPGGNKYLYLEGSVASGNSSRIISPCIDLTNNTSCLAFEFYYHMFGSDCKRLRIDIDTGSTTEHWWTNYKSIINPQQTSSTDAWKREVVSLEQFNGQFIRIRLHGVRNGTGDLSDIAIDDWRIFEPDPAEIELVEYKLPQNGFCGYTANEPITVVVRNNGCVSTQAIPLAFQVNGTGTVFRDTIKNPPTSLSLGDTITYTLTPTADLSAFGNYNIKVWSEMPGDANLTNDTVFSPTIEHNPTISSFPYVEDFENGFKLTQVIGNTDWKFTNGLDPNFRWQVGEGLTTTRQTGPFQGFHHGGKYLYAETGGPNGLAVSTYFQSLCFDLTGLTDPTLDFFYHLYGADIANLTVEASLGDGFPEVWTTVPGSVINNGTGQSNETDDWKFKRISLAAYAGGYVKLRFKATRNAGGFEADIAIDKIMVYDKLTNDAGAYLITRPDIGVQTWQTNPTKPKVKVINYGSSNLTSFDVTVDVTPYCGANAGVTSSYTETVTANIAPGADDEIILSGFNLNWPVGEFNITASTSLAGDTYGFQDSINRSFWGVARYDIPYFDNFDNCNYEGGGFQPNKSNTFFQWELGSPLGTTISSAHSSPNAWVTRLNGNFYPQTEEILNAPFLRNFVDIYLAELRFWHYLDFGTGTPQAAGRVEYQNAGNWDVLGGNNISASVGLNWLGSPFANQANPVFNGPAFEGSSTPAGGWIPSSYTLREFNNAPSNAILRLRFRFMSNHPIGTSVNSTSNGWGIDDFELYVPPQHSAGIVDYKSVSPLPIPGSDQEFEFTIVNSGAQLLDSVKVQLNIDGNPVGTADWYRMDKFMTRGLTKRFIYNHKWPGPQVTSGSHCVEFVAFLPDNFPDDFNDDDTLKDCSFDILGEIDLGPSADSVYCTDFERTDPNYVPWITRRSDFRDTCTNIILCSPLRPASTWEWGDPLSLDSAYNGSNAWMTKLNEEYATLDNSSLFSPIFIVDSNQNYELSFWHWYETERFHDGGNLEITFDGGITWTPIGYQGANDSNWYNTQFVTSLDIIRPGWTDTSGTWVYADYNLAFENVGTKAIFRFRFGADWDINYRGWAMDQFCFKKTTSNPQVVIGQEEFKPDVELLVTDIAPNPTNSVADLSIYSSNSNKVANIAIVNSIGQLMETREEVLMDGINKISLDGSRWDSGVYIVRIEIDGEIFNKKLIISR